MQRMRRSGSRKPSVSSTFFEQFMVPNLSLNADVPRAGLRPGSGPPVSLYR